jgi:hypothetical protein
MFKLQSNYFFLLFLLCQGICKKNKSFLLLMLKQV